jgi:putative membrane protein
MGAPYPNELQLQHVPTPFALAALAWIHRRSLLGTHSIFCLLSFLWLHILGARWLYSMVPYDDWTMFLFGFSVSESMGWSRNHYDRLVHFASGLLFLPPLADALRRTGYANANQAIANAFAWVLAIGAMYEILEWQLAVTMSPHMAESYNGQQGDIWDAQQDLALAMFGAVCAGVLLWIREHRPRGDSLENHGGKSQRIGPDGSN